MLTPKAAKPATPKFQAKKPAVKENVKTKENQKPKENVNKIPPKAPSSRTESRSEIPPKPIAKIASKVEDPKDILSKENKEKMKKIQQNVNIQAK